MTVPVPCAALPGRRSPPARWTHIYWPLALFAGVLGFVVTGFAAPSQRGNALIAATVVLAAPELWCFAQKRTEDTLSDWVWNSVHVTGTQPMSRWTAEHFLLFGAYLVLAAAVDRYLFGQGLLWFGVGVVMSVWLCQHLFFHWWAG